MFDVLIELLAAPAAATAGHDDAYTLLSSLGIPDLLATMEGVTDRGYLPQLHARVISWTNPFTAARLISALYAVELVRVSPAAHPRVRPRRDGRARGAAVGVPGGRP